MKNKTLDALKGTKARFEDALENDKTLEEAAKTGIRKMIAILDALINAYSS